jgi:hypothetical protein
LEESQQILEKSGNFDHFEFPSAPKNVVHPNLEERNNRESPSAVSEISQIAAILGANLCRPHVEPISETIWDGVDHDESFPKDDEIPIPDEPQGIVVLGQCDDSHVEDGESWNEFGTPPKSDVRTPIFDLSQSSSDVDPDEVRPDNRQVPIDVPTGRWAQHPPPCRSWFLMVLTRRRFWPVRGSFSTGCWIMPKS